MGICRGRIGEEKEILGFDEREWGNEQKKKKKTRADDK